MSSKLPYSAAGFTPSVSESSFSSQQAKILDDATQVASASTAMAGISGGTVIDVNVDMDKNMTRMIALPFTAQNSSELEALGLSMVLSGYSLDWTGSGYSLTNTSTGNEFASIRIWDGQVSLDLDYLNFEERPFSDFTVTSATSGALSFNLRATMAGGDGSSAAKAVQLIESGDTTVYTRSDEDAPLFLKGSAGKDHINFNPKSGGTNIALGAGDDTLIMYDNASNCIISGSDNNFISLGMSLAADNTINLGSGHDTIFGGGSINRGFMNLSGGDNLVELTGAISADSSGLAVETNITASDGNDTVRIENSAAKLAMASWGSTINLGNGDNEIIMSGTIANADSYYGCVRYTTVATGTGNDALSIKNTSSEAGGHALLFSTVKLGDGNNLIELQVGSEFNDAAGASAITTGSGNDTIESNGCMYNTTINLGNGKNVLDITAESTYTMEKGSTTLGTGDDVVTINGSLVLGGHVLDVGAGTNTVSLEAEGNYLTEGIAISNYYDSHEKKTYTGHLKSGVGNDVITVSGSQSAIVDGRFSDAGGNNEITLEGAKVALQNALVSLGTGESSVLVKSIDSFVKWGDAAQNSPFNYNDMLDLYASWYNDEEGIAKSNYAQGAGLGVFGGKFTTVGGSNELIIDATHVGVLGDIGHKNLTVSGSVVEAAYVRQAAELTLGGVGNNNLEITANGYAVYGAKLTLGSGKDSIHIQGGEDQAMGNNGSYGLTSGHYHAGMASSSLTVAGGDNTIEISGYGKTAYALHSSTVTLGAGNDSITLVAQGGKVASYNPNIYEGQQQCALYKSVVNTGAGNDSITVEGSVGAGAKILAGAGNDTIALTFKSEDVRSVVGSQSAIDNGARIDGGAGLDVIKIVTDGVPVNLNLYEIANTGYGPLCALSSIEVIALDSTAQMSVDTYSVSSVKTDIMASGPLKGQAILRFDGELGAEIRLDNVWQVQDSYWLDGKKYNLFQNERNGKPFAKMLIESSVALKNYDGSSAWSAEIQPEAPFFVMDEPPTYTYGDAPKVLQLSYTDGNAVVEDVSYRFGKGADKVIVKAGSASGLIDTQMDLGEGNNTLQISLENTTGVGIQGSSELSFVLAGGGNDSVTITGGRCGLEGVGINLGEGSNVISVTSEKALADAWLVTGTGKDSITLTGAVEASKVETASGNDTVMFNGTLDNQSVVDMGTGADVLFLKQEQVAGTLKGGFGMDTLNITHLGDTSLAGLRGNANVSGFEVVDMTNKKGNALSLRAADLDDFTGMEKLVFTGNAAIPKNTSGYTAVQLTAALKAEDANVLRINGDTGKTGDTVYFENEGNDNWKLVGTAMGYNVYANTITDGVNPFADAKLVMVKSGVNVAFSHVADVYSSINTFSSDDSVYAISVLDNRAETGITIKEAAGVVDKAGELWNLKNDQGDVFATLSFDENGALVCTMTNSGEIPTGLDVAYTQGGEDKLLHLAFAPSSGSGFALPNTAGVSHYTTNGTVTSSIVGTASDDFVEFGFALGTSAKRLSVDLGAGNDTLWIRSDAQVGGFVGTDVKLGEGNNLLDLYGEAGADLSTFSAGSGNDTLRFDSTNGFIASRVDLGNGDNVAVISSDSSALMSIYDKKWYTAELKTGLGNDNIDVSAASVVLQNASLIDTGGTNTISLRGNIAMNSSVLKTGDGNDSVSLEGDITNSSISLGKGENTLDIVDSGFGGVYGGTVAASTITLGINDDTLKITNTRYADAFCGSTLDMGNGNNRVEITVQGSGFAGLHTGNKFIKSTVKSGTGNDTFEITSGTDPHVAGIVDTVMTDTGGNNRLTVTGGIASVFSSITLGKGDDIVILTGTSGTSAQNSILSAGMLPLFDESDALAGTGMYASKLNITGGNNEVYVEADHIGLIGDIAQKTVGKGASATVVDYVKSTADITIAGNGNNIVSIDAEYYGMYGGKVTLGSGRDVVSVTAGAASDPSVAGTYAALTNSALAIAGGNNEVTLAAHGENAYAVHNSSVKLGAGNDTLSLTSTGDTSFAIAGSVVDAGAGNDLITLEGALEKATLTAGAGNDTVRLVYSGEVSSVLHTNATLDGGAGYDVLRLGGTLDSIDDKIALSNLVAGELTNKSQIKSFEMLYLEKADNQILVVDPDSLKYIVPDAMITGPLKGQRILRIGGVEGGIIEFADAAWEIGDRYYFIDGRDYRLLTFTSGKTVQRVLVDVCLNVNIDGALAHWASPDWFAPENITGVSEVNYTDKNNVVRFASEHGVDVIKDEAHYFGRGADKVTIALTGDQTALTNSIMQLGEGNNSLTVTGTGAGKFIAGTVDFGTVKDGALVLGGSGADVVHMSGVATGLGIGSAMNLGDGNNKVTIVATDKAMETAMLQMGNNNDTVLLTGDVMGSTVNVGDGNNLVQIAGDVIASSIIGGFHNDILQITGNADNALILGGYGNDKIEITGNILNTGTVSGGSGNDTVILHGALDATSQADMGAGADILYLKQEQAAAQLQGGEGLDTLNITALGDISLTDLYGTGSVSGFEIIDMTNKKGNAFTIRAADLDDFADMDKLVFTGNAAIPKNTKGYTAVQLTAALKAEDANVLRINGDAGKTGDTVNFINEPGDSWRLVGTASGYNIYSSNLGSAIDPFGQAKLVMVKSGVNIIFSSNADVLASVNPLDAEVALGAMESTAAIVAVEDKVVAGTGQDADKWFLYAPAAQQSGFAPFGIEPPYGYLMQEGSLWKLYITNQDAAARIAQMHITYMVDGEEKLLQLDFTTPGSTVVMGNTAGVSCYTDDQISYAVTGTIGDDLIQAGAIGDFDAKKKGAISLGNGNDTIEVGSLGLSTIDLGSGHNKLEVTDANGFMPSNTIIAGDGNDTLIFNGLYADGNKINLGDGDNVVTVNGFAALEDAKGKIISTASLNTGIGNDLITLAGLGGGVSNATITDKGGNNSISITGTSDVDGGDGMDMSKLNTGAGNDTIHIAAVKGSTLPTDGGDCDGMWNSTIVDVGGNNEIKVSSWDADAMSRSTITTGAGNDSFIIDGGFCAMANSSITTSGG